MLRELGPRHGSWNSKLEPISEFECSLTMHTYFGAISLSVTSQLTRRTSFWTQSLRKRLRNGSDALSRVPAGKLIASSRNIQTEMKKKQTRASQLLLWQFASHLPFRIKLCFTKATHYRLPQSHYLFPSYSNKSTSNVHLVLLCTSGQTRLVFRSSISPQRLCLNT